MARAARRQSELAALKDEVKQLREAGRQLMAGLSEYAKAENWLHHGDDIETSTSIRWEWIGEGDGPKIARKYLGLEEENN